ncbi:hypothetical protein H8E88_10440 [candidate division KSB1 bacterium]|nr:hypothetical protein [candidate division KSB1 bacterium]MBL7093195.1 hypothetical protein [candidate division KSB1 bacterium]
MRLIFINSNTVLKMVSILLFIFFFISCSESKKSGSGKNLQELPVLITEDFEDGKTDEWVSYPKEVWKIIQDSGSKVYALIHPGPEREIRSPQAYTLLKNFDVKDFVFTGKIKSTQDTLIHGRDMNVVFHYQDLTHFYYVHFCKQSASKHNIIGIVNGKDRVKINHEPAGESNARLGDKSYHNFKVTYQSRTGEIKAFLDDMDVPILTATDSTLSHGLVGVGSFDDTGCFDDVQLRGINFLQNKQ